MGAGAARRSRRLSYTFDQDDPGRGAGTEWRTRALVVLRHAQARARKAWRKDDRLRPLLSAGQAPGRSG